MSVRIRYSTPSDPNVLESVKSYATSEVGEVRVVIDKRTNKFSLLNLATGMFMLGGEGTSLHKAKIAAKRRLESLGVRFEEEERNV